MVYNIYKDFTVLSHTCTKSRAGRECESVTTKGSWSHKLAGQRAVVRGSHDHSDTMESVASCLESVGQQWSRVNQHGQGIQIGRPHWANKSIARLSLPRVAKRL